MSIMSLESSALTMRVLMTPELSAISADSLCRTLCSLSAATSSSCSLLDSRGKSNARNSGHSTEAVGGDGRENYEPKRSNLNALRLPSCPHEIWWSQYWYSLKSSAPSMGDSVQGPKTNLTTQQLVARWL